MTTLLDLLWPVLRIGGHVIDPVEKALATPLDDVFAKRLAGPIRIEERRVGGRSREMRVVPLGFAGTAELHVPLSVLGEDALTFSAGDGVLQLRVPKDAVPRLSRWLPREVRGWPDPERCGQHVFTLRMKKNGAMPLLKLGPASVYLQYQGTRP